MMDKQNINGILLLDKPMGLTSNAALQQAKRCYRARTAGHSGSLDPLATGILPILFGEATKLAQFLLDSNKRYRVTARLGIRTDTADSDGNIIATREVPMLLESDLDAVLDRFKGSQQQVPPMFSAIKQNGQPLYKLARQGKVVERAPRSIHIDALTLIDRTPDSLTLDVSCSKGTYIRTLVDDLGEVLGCGAHVTALRRTATASFVESETVTLEQLKTLSEQGDKAVIQRLLLPADSAIRDWPSVQLSESAAFYVKNGQAVRVSQAPAQGWVSLKLQQTQECIGVGLILEDGRVAPKRLFKF